MLEKKKNEKNIPAQQEKEKEKPWLSGQDENQRRPTHHQAQTTKGKKKNGWLMKETFRPRERIRNKRDFLLLFKEGKRYKDKYFNLIYFPNNLSFSRMAVIISKKVGNAVTRNKMRRWIRDLFRRNKEFLKDNLDILIIVKKDIQETSWTTLRENYLRAIKSICKKQS